jgi:hypothetical protein
MLASSFNSAQQKLGPKRPSYKVETATDQSRIMAVSQGDLSNNSFVLPFRVEQAVVSRPTNTILHDNLEDVNVPTIFPKIDIKLPKTFDGRKVWAGLLNPTMNQGKCGSCWAFATASALADKFNIQSMGQMHVELSPVRMIICNYISDPEYSIFLDKASNEAMLQANIEALQQTACFGNTLIDAWNFLYIWGTNTKQCAPYADISEFVNVANLPLCTGIFGLNADMCSDFRFLERIGIETGTPARFYRCKHFYLLPTTGQDPNNQEHIKNSIYRFGPVTASFEVYPNFYTFDPKKEIYDWDGQGQVISGHAIEIVGWGEREFGNDIIPYWIIKNFWGTEWGMNGYFYMIRGKNSCKLEDNVIEGVPDFFYPSNYEPDHLYYAQISEGNISTMRRFIVDNQVNLLNGGIDPETGYSRRVLRGKPWIDKSRPVPLENLPDFNNWIAGKDATIEGRYKFKASLNERSKNICNGNENMILILFIGGILTILILILFYLEYRKSYKSINRKK